MVTRRTTAASRRTTTNNNDSSSEEEEQPKLTRRQQRALAQERARAYMQEEAAKKKKKRKYEKDDNSDDNSKRIDDDSPRRPSKRARRTPSSPNTKSTTTKESSLSPRKAAAASPKSTSTSRSDRKSSRSKAPTSPTRSSSSRRSRPPPSASGSSSAAKPPFGSPPLQSRRRSTRKASSPPLSTTSSPTRSSGRLRSSSTSKKPPVVEQQAEEPTSSEEDGLVDANLGVDQLGESLKTPHDDDSSIMDEEEDEGIGREEGTIAAALFESKNSWVWSLIAVVGVAMVSVLLATFNPQGITVPSLSTLAPSSSRNSVISPPCFEDTYPTPYERDEGEDPPPVPSHCVGQERIKCPDNAICDQGMVQSCSSNRYYEIQGYQCVRNLATNETIAAMVDQLKQWTVLHYCGDAGDFDLQTHTETGLPLFHYSRLTGELELGYDWKLVQIANENDAKNFFTERRGDALYIGLHSAHKVSYPLTCSTRKGISFMTAMLFSVLYSVIVMVVSTVFDLVWKEPLGTSVLAGVFYALFSRWKRRKALMEQEKLVIALRQATFDRLAMDPSKSLFEIHVCEELKWQFFPSSQAAREHMVAVLWPLVKQQVEEDGRIRKSTALLPEKAGKQQSGRKWRWEGPRSPTAATN